MNYIKKEVLPQIAGGLLTSPRAVRVNSSETRSCYVYLTRCMVYGYAPPEERKLLALNHYYQVLGCFPELVGVADDKVGNIFLVFLFGFKNI